jgi:hypothetical protein
MARVIHGLLLFPAAFVYLVLSKTHAVAKSALVPGVVDSDDELVEANSKLALIGVVMGFVAAVPGVPVLKLVGGRWVLRMAAAVFAAGALAALRITQPRDDSGDKAVRVFGRAPSTSGASGASGASAEAEAASLAVRERGIRLAAIAMGGLRGSVGFLTFLIAFGLRRDHAPAWLFGVALAASMGGTMVGAGLAPRVRRAVREERLLAMCLVFLGGAGLAMTRVPGRTGSVVLAAVVGLSASAGKLAFDSLVQRDAPGAVRGRQFARFEAAFQLTWVAGALIPVVVHIPPRFGAFLLGVGGVALAAAYVSGTRSR